MIEVRCLYENEYRTEYAYRVEEFPYDELDATTIKDKTVHYIAKPITFDIEVSTTKNEYESIKKGRDIYEGFMYHWQICIEGIVVFGRRWEELINFLARIQMRYGLSKQKKLVIYVHNLSYEFHFIYDFIRVTKVFSTKPRKVLKCIGNDCFEFRCSYMLSNMNLAKFIENSGGKHNKAKKDLDFKKVRTPKSELSKEELGYCYNDVMGLYEAVMDKLNEDTIATIPMTSTGYVRRECRNAMRTNKSNYKSFKKMQLDGELYKIVKKCFRGGNTASSRYLTDVELKDVYSYDISSSYPHEMMSKEFPNGEFMKVEVDSLEELLEYNREYLTIGKYIFNNIQIKDLVPIPYIPFSKCTKVLHEKNYNGRILKSSYIEIYMTHIDFEIVDKQYTYGALYVTDLYICRKKKLPQELRTQIMKYYHDKTKLKNVDRYNYNKSKSRLNSIWGMCVTDIVHDEIEFTEDKEFKPNEISEDDIATKLNKYYNGRNNFLTYQWGIFVTAYARKSLQVAIDAIGLDVIYCDTDSVKCIGNKNKIINDINENIMKICQDDGVENYVTISGKKVIMGIFENEGEKNQSSYDIFKTLGAKKYAYEKNGKIGVTVSGLNKESGGEELQKKGGLKFFKEGEIFYKSGRSTAQYNNVPKHTITINGDTFTTGSNIAIIDVPYTLGMTGTMKDILLQCKGGDKDAQNRKSNKS